MTTDLQGFPVELKKLGRNALLSNDFSFGIVKKISQKNCNPEYEGRLSVVELNEETNQLAKKKEPKQHESTQ